MQLVITGVHQRTAPVAVRERLAFRPDELVSALQALRQYADEGFIISTCNRVEVYGLVPDGPAGTEALASFLASWHYMTLDELTPHLYTYTGTEAARHIFRMASGLDSMVLGEDQIMGQIKGALATAHAAGSIGNVLHRLLHSALATGKIVRTNTAIAHNHLSVVSVAIDLARQAVGELAERRCLVIGAGHMAELSLKYLHCWQAAPITVTNRTFARAEQLAAGYGAHAWPFEQLEDALAASDIVFSGTAAPGVVIDAAMVARAMAGRDAPLLLIDLAVPRDIDPQVRALPGVQLIDIDDMQAVAQANRAARIAEVDHAEALIASEIAKFESWMSEQKIVPTIRALRERAEAIRAAELQRTLAKCPALDEHARQAIEALTSAIVNKLLHYPIATLKGAGDSPEMTHLVHELFHLTEPSAPPARRPAPATAEIVA